ncbi:MAG: hypothetical protein DRG83_16145 [Deltaproteobacteria bacterium]|nr:MAG: hypothetical protein DRG83_16145 [Deltaproteobacteria bacterium]
MTRQGGRRKMITVAIVVRNGGKTISRTLDSIFSGQLRPDEVLIIDGLSEDNTLEVVKSYTLNYDNIRVIDNPQRKIAPGRNIAVKEAWGDVIAYTDADCVVDRKWLFNISKRFEEDPTLAGCGGRMLPLPPHNELEKFAGKVFLKEIMQYDNRLRYCSRLSVAGALITANSAYRRDVLLEVGGFDEWFGNYGEDIDLYWRLIKSGYKLLYDPDIVVYHRFPQTLGKFLKKHFGFGIASSKLTKKHLSRMCVDWMLYHKLFSDLWFLLSLRGSKDKVWGILQKCTHIMGKIYGSLRAGVVNL